uniref:Receptor-interacting serine/threonine-protein kinase 1-like n=1 Tax=Phallusia mammillata TaxID=59560 RepID=A0A6F9DQ87_9ASCI|nr:receptor-interacting serine/threonine-protein kinase 1-like [Phallusia mammillata]
MSVKMVSVQPGVMERCLMSQLPHDLPELPANDLKTSHNKLDYIGSGSFGAVRRCYYDRLGEVAVKCIPLIGTPEEMMSSWKSFKAEANVIPRLNHPNIVEVYGVTKWNSNVGLILEYVGGKNLEKLIRDKFAYSRSIGLKLVHQLSAAIKHLHTVDSQKKINHGDIKSSNILITPQFALKLADFGAANVRAATGCQSSSLTLDTSTVHTLLYAAPEILSGEGYKDHERDVYSFAVVAYEILTAKLVYNDFPGMKEQELYVAIMNGQRPNLEHISNDDPVKPLIVSCWSQNPTDRPKIIEVEKRLSQIIEDELGDKMDASVVSPIKIPDASRIADRVGLDRFLYPYKESRI